MTFPAYEYSRGLAFHPVDGKLYFSARNDGSSTALNYVDALTLPGHQRTRVWDDSGEPSDIYAYEPFFDDAANLHLAAYNTNGGGYGYYRVTAQGLARLGSFPTYLNAFGPFTVNTLQFSPAGAALGCIPTRTRACLQGRRFQVEATYDATIFGGSAGTATPNVESDQSLKFSFFDETNLELFLKVIDGCSYNGHYWVFVSGLTNAGVALQLTDKVTNAVYSYSNPAGQAFAPSLDIEAFACN